MGKPVRARTLTGEIRKDRANARALLNRSAFTDTGMHPNGEGGIDSDNFVAGASGYSFKADGNAEFNDLTLRGGIIGNDALTNPVAPGAIWADAHGFSLSTAYVNKVIVTITVPAGFTTAVVSVVGRVFAYNPTASLDYLYSVLDIAGNNGNGLPLAVSGSGGSGTSVAPFSTVLTGLTPGSTFTVVLSAATSNAAWAANAGNTAELSGSVIWFR